MTDFSTFMEVFDDGLFSIYKTRFGTYEARDKEGNGITSSLSKDATEFWAREHLTGFPNSYAVVTRVAVTSDSLK